MGDPSGRKTERDKLHRETLEENLAGLSECLNRIFINDRLRSDSNTELKYTKTESNEVKLVRIACVLLKLQGFKQC